MASSIESRNLVGSALAVLLTGAAFLAVFRFMDRSSAAVAERFQVNLALQSLNQALSDLTDAETGQRGYLLTGQEAYLEPYTRGSREAAQSLDAFLAAGTVQNLAQQDLDGLRSRSALKLDELRRTVDLARGGHREAAVAVVKGGEGHRAMEEIRLVHDRLERALLARRARTDQIVLETGSSTRKALVGFGGLALACLLYSLWALARDARHRLARERALEASERRFQLLVDGIQDYAIILLDTEGRVTTWNAGAERIKGYTAPEILGASGARFYPPEQAERFAALLAEARERGRVEDEAWRVRKDGSRFWADVVITAVRDGEGKLLGYAKITRDLTERRRSNEALRASESRFRALAETAPIGIYRYDFAEGAVYANGAHCDLTGLPRGTASREAFRNAVHPEDRPRVLAQVEAAMAGGRPFDETYRLRHADGRVLWVRSLGAPLEGPEGPREGYLFVTQDITEALEAEAEITAKAEALEAANQELESFAYSVSHDLRAPLRHIDGFVGLLRKSLGGSADDRARHHLEVISGAARQMGALIDDLLSFSRMGRAEVRKTDLDLGALVRRVVDDLAPDAAGRDIEWRIGELPRVHADPALLRLALLNLVGNALKFTRGRSPARIGISAASQGSMAAVTIRDNGAGFDMRHADKLFGVFQRLHRQDEFEGTGIGLANVARIIHKHGGQVAAEGVPGEGAAFTFTLPMETP